MRNIISALLLLSIALSMATSCTHNNGDIGDWFGHWKLNTITVDGMVDDSYEGNIFFSFQGGVFAQILVKPNHGAGMLDRHYANWEDHGSYIIINYPYHTDENGNPVYNENGELKAPFKPLPVTRMSIGDNTINVDRKKGNDLQLSMTDADGHTVVYNLEKW